MGSLSKPLKPHPINRLDQTLEIIGGRQAVVAALDQVQPDVSARQTSNKGRGMTPGHHIVGPALKDMDRRGDGQGRIQQKPVTAVLEHVGRAAIPESPIPLSVS